MKPRLTIATTTFGESKYLDECIASSYAQTIPVVHKIVAGGQVELLKRSLPKHVEVTAEDPDPGMVECWNKAASNTTTEYLSFLADDNCLESCFAEKMLLFLDSNPKCDLVFCEQSTINAQGEKDILGQDERTSFFGRDVLPEGILSTQWLGHLLRKNSIPLESSVLRIDAWKKWGEFNPKAKGAFDTEFLYRILLGGGVVGFINEPLMSFRWHDDAYSLRKSKEHLLGYIYAMDSLSKTKGDYSDFFTQQTNQALGRMLRYQMSTAERSRLILKLARKKRGLQIIVKNSIAALYGYNT